MNDPQASVDVPRNAGHPGPSDRRSVLRSLMESTICLLLAVLLFRTFAAEGYMISTGSMAPHLLGFHKRVECPTCHFTFPFGVAYDTDEADVSAAEIDQSRTHAVCPNCGQRGINLTQVPRNHGDQLLVFKPAFGFRPPQRWEVVVFRNPGNPREAYVKRAVGLPGERIQIIDGDVYADGRLCRKNLETQRHLRVPVYSHHHQPQDEEETRPRWSPIAASPVGSEAWTATGEAFERRNSPGQDWAWVEYASWVRYRGHHETAVPLEEWPEDIDPTVIPPAGLKYDARSRQLSCIGALPASVRDKLLAHPAPEDFHAAITRLYEESHVAPVSDEYGYNPHDGTIVPVPMRDVMVSLQLEHADGEGEFAIEMTDGNANFTCVFDLKRRAVRLYAANHEDAVAEGGLSPEFGRSPATVEMSLFDQQVCVAVDGHELLTPWVFSTPQNTPHPRFPVRFGAQGLDVRVAELIVYRDVYYTGTRSRNAIQNPYQLGEHQLFVLGDNSPVSHDSRRWNNGAVDTSLLIGKPFIVHLPSRPGRLRLGAYETQLRLPDFERIQRIQ